MDYLRQGIYLRGYAQKQPKQEFKRESFELFQTMLERIKAEIVQMLARIRIRSDEEVALMEAEQQRMAESQRLQLPACRSRRDGPGPGSARRGRRRTGGTRPASEGRSQRSLPLRLGQEIQAVPRPLELIRKTRRKAGFSMWRRSPFGPASLFLVASLSVSSLRWQDEQERRAERGSHPPHRHPGAGRGPVATTGY